MAQDNYPEILGNMFIINAPFLFTGIWAIVKVWIDDKTKEKIKILGSSYKKELLQYVSSSSCRSNQKTSPASSMVAPVNALTMEAIASVGTLGPGTPRDRKCSSGILLNPKD
jgi:hypothetical protein